GRGATTRADALAALFPADTSGICEIKFLNMADSQEQIKKSWWDVKASQWAVFCVEREEQVFLVLTLLIGALVGLSVVAFIVVTERVGARLYPVGSAPWRRLLVPSIGSLAMGYLLFRFFPDARGS